MPELNNTETFVCFLHCLESGLELRSVMRNPNWEAVRGCGLNSSGRMQNATATPGQLICSISFGDPSTK